MRDEELYRLLRGAEDREVSWVKGAEQFLKLKTASGGLREDQKEELRLHGRKLAMSYRMQDALTKEAAEIKSAAPMVHLPGVAQAEAKKRLLKRLGVAGGAVAGTAAVALGGREIFKRHLAKRKEKTAQPIAVADPITPEEVGSALRRGALSAVRSKITGDISHAERIKRKRGERWGSLLGTLGGGAAGALLGKKVAPGLSWMAGPAGMAAGAVGGKALGKTVGEEVDRKKILKGFPQFSSGVESTGAIEKESALELALDNDKTPIDKEASAFLQKLSSLQKRANEDAEIPIESGLPGNEPEEEDEDGDPLEGFLAAQQQANEADFFRQQADEAAARAEQLEEQAEMLEQQNQQLQQQAQMAQQQGEQQSQMSQQQTQMAQQQSQMAQQDAVQARDESLGVQQQNIAMRQAITQYRQQLMDLLAQDPTAELGPPPAPQTPMMGVPPGAGPEQGGPPPEEGGPPGPEQGGPPGPEQGGPPPGMEGAPPEGMPPEMQGGPPSGPPPMQAPPQSPTGVTVNVKPPKAGAAQ